MCGILSYPQKPNGQVRAIGAIEAIGDAAWHTNADRLLGGLPGQ